MAEVKNVLKWILVANILVAALKILFGNIIASTSMVADGFHSMTDGMSNVAGLVGIWLAGRPRDKNHPYGHKRYENMTSLCIGGVLLFFAIRVAAEAAEKIQHPGSPQITLESLMVLLFTLVVNIFIASYEYKKGQQLSSDILIADSLHTRSDIFVTCGVLGALVAIHYGAPPLVDPLVSLVVVLFILHAAWSILKKTGEVLVDHAAVDDDLVKETARCFPAVLDVHKVRSRSSGGNIYVDMHIIIAPEMSVEDAHKLAHDIEERLKSDISADLEVLIHPEPARDEKIL